MLRTRVWTALAILPVLLAIIVFAPRPLFAAIIAIFAVIALSEIAAMTGARTVGRISVLGLSAILPAVAVYFGPDLVLLPEIAGAGLFLMTSLMLVHGPGHGPHGAPLIVTGGFYVGVFFPFFVLLRNCVPNGVALTVLMLLLAVATDSAAYFVGRAIGRTRLAPNVSPNKTVEGAIGGLVAALAAGYIMRPLLVPHWEPAMAATVATAVSILAQAGDLVGSALKRAAGVKDSGWIFPGHGGLIDRSCSLVLAAAFTYYYCR